MQIAYFGGRIVYAPEIPGLEHHVHVRMEISREDAVMMTVDCTPDRYVET